MCQLSTDIEVGVWLLTEFFKQGDVSLSAKSKFLELKNCCRWAKGINRPLIKRLGSDFWMELRFPLGWLLYRPASLKLLLNWVFHKLVSEVSSSYCIYVPGKLILTKQGALRDIAEVFNCVKFNVNLWKVLCFTVGRNSHVTIGRRSHPEQCIALQCIHVINYPVGSTDLKMFRFFQ